MHLILGICILLIFTNLFKLLLNIILINSISWSRLPKHLKFVFLSRHDSRIDQTAYQIKYIWFKNQFEMFYARNACYFPSLRIVGCMKSTIPIVRIYLSSAKIWFYLIRWDSSGRIGIHVQMYGKSERRMEMRMLLLHQKLVEQPIQFVAGLN